MTTRSPSSSDDQCIGVHVPDQPFGNLRVNWYPVRSLGERVRIRDYTCDCQETFYELCQAGGVLFIRRTRRSGRGVLVDESARRSHRVIITLWDELRQCAAHFARRMGSEEGEARSETSRVALMNGSVAKSAVATPCVCRSPV